MVHIVANILYDVPTSSYYCVVDKLRMLQVNTVGSGCALKHWHCEGQRGALLAELGSRFLLVHRAATERKIQLKLLLLHQKVQVTL